MALPVDKNAFASRPTFFLSLLLGIRGGNADRIYHAKYYVVAMRSILGYYFILVSYAKFLQWKGNIWRRSSVDWCAMSAAAAKYIRDIDADLSRIRCRGQGGKKRRDAMLSLIYNLIILQTEIRTRYMAQRNNKTSARWVFFLWKLGGF